MNVRDINSLVELFFKKADKINKNKPFLEWLNPKNNLKYNWGDVVTKVYQLTSKFKNLIEEGDRVIILSENRPEWLITDIAIMNAGGISVPIFTTYAERDYEYIINDCSPSLIIVSESKKYDKIKKFVKHNKVISFEKFNDSIQSYNQIFENNFEKIENKNLERKKPACIIYTSGTSGTPKGVVLSHGGILSNCEGAQELLQPIISKKNPVFLTWLPLSHSYEHTVQMIQVLLGAKVFYAESLDKLIFNMGEAKPTIMTAVPRFYQTLYTKINLNFDKQTGIKKMLIFQTVSLGKKILRKIQLTFFEKIQNFFCEILVRKKIQRQFGGNLQAFVSGGGALDKNIGEFLNAIGLPTLQGYGLTETSPVVSCNLPGLVKVDTVGPPFRFNKVKIASDGEILVKGENVMLEYWNQKEATDEVLKDGWLHTGDVGIIDSSGYLKITDRKKDIIINLGGDNISPSKIENILCLNDAIKQSFVYGDKKNYLVALIVAEKEISKEKIKTILENINKNLTLIEKIKKFILIHEEFTIVNGMLTPTLKLKRKEIIKNYKQQLENLYK